jgi:DNA repair exonuclease SbcCD nuclease subunit
MKLLHAADLHIDSPLRGLSAYEGAPAEDIRVAARRAVTNLVDLARAEGVDMVLLAGDVFDGDWQDYNTGLFYAHQLRRLADAGIRVVVVAGNHDAESRITRELTLPDTVHRLPTEAPGTLEFADLGLAVHGQGFERRAVTENLARAYPPPRAGAFNVGLLHTSLTGRHGHDPYAPCSPADLRARGYDYWALGHVHTREVVADGDPWIVFPGNIQGRHARETGPKGATLITVDDLRVTGVEHRVLDVVRWAHVQVDGRALADLEDAWRAVSDALGAARADSPGRLVAARVTITGPSDAHEALWRDRDRLTAEARLAARDHDGVWLEKVRLATSHPATPDGPADLPGIVDDLRRTAALLRAEPDAIARLVEQLPVVRQLDHEIARELERESGRDAEWHTRVFDEAVELLAALVDDGDATGRTA